MSKIKHITKTKFENKLALAYGIIFYKKVKEENVLCTLYYNEDNKHIGTWTKTKSFIFN